MSAQVYSWRVEATIPATWKEGRYTQNMALQVIASTLEDAVSAVKNRYPDVTFYKVMVDRHLTDVIVADGFEREQGIE